MRANKDKRIQWINLIQTYVHNKIKKQYIKKKKLNLLIKYHDNVTKESMKKLISIIGGYGSGKKTRLLNLIKHENDDNY